ncbi:MAG: hypothetical protein IJ463_02790 [Bacilli bacterium]|nr:hypothetical protein [Bacilli bacterium]
MTELSLLSNEELLYLKYNILREASNYSNNYIMATRFENELSKLKITNKKDLKIDFNNYEKVIYKILLNRTNDINIDLLTDIEKKELIDLLDKVIYIFSINKEENINKYNELEFYKKQVFKRLKKYDLKELLSLLDNPLDNDNLIIELNNQMLSKAIPDSRKIYLSKDNLPINTSININDLIKTVRKILKDSLKYYISINKDKKYYSKLSEFIKLNLEKILSDEAINLLKKDNYIEYFETKDEDIIKLLKFLQNEVLLLKTDHYGYSKYEELVPENTKFFLNPSTEKNTFNYDLRIYINTQDNIETYLFLNEYRKKCRSLNIEFNMKGITPGIDYYRKDNTVLYSLIRDLPLRIRILNEIEIEHPEWISTFKEPLSIGSRINDSYYSITKAGISTIDETRTEIYGFKMSKVHVDYTDYFDLIERYAFYSNMARLVIENEKIFSYVDLKYKKAFINFAKLCNIETFEPIGLINKYKTNNISIENIINYLRKYKFHEILKKENISLDNNESISRYKIRLQSLANISEGRNVNSKVSVTMSSLMQEYLD